MCLLEFEGFYLMVSKELEAEVNVEWLLYGVRFQRDDDKRNLTDHIANMSITTNLSYSVQLLVKYFEVYPHFSICS